MSDTVWRTINLTKRYKNRLAVDHLKHRGPAGRCVWISGSQRRGEKHHDPDDPASRFRSGDVRSSGSR